MRSRALVVALIVLVCGGTQVLAQAVALRSDSFWRSATQPARSQTLHVLLAAATNDQKFGAGVREDLARLTTALQRSAPDGVRINFEVIHGAMANYEDTWDAIRESAAGNPPI
jgi:hypothetical protein